MRIRPAVSWGAFLLFACSRICWGAGADAQPAGRRVELIIGATPSEANLLEPSIREMLAPKGLTVLTERKRAVTAQDVATAIAPPKEATPSVARVLLDFTVSGQATLFLIDPRRGRVFVRRMSLAHDLDAVARASVRFVIEQSIDAILEGRDIGVSREEFERGAVPPPPEVAPARAAPAAATPAPAPAALEPTLAGTHLSLAGGYEIVPMGSSEYQQAARIEVGARFEGLQLAAVGRLAAPLTVAGDGVRALLSSGGFGVVAAEKLTSVGSLSFTAGLGAGLDLTHVEPVVTTSGLQAQSTFWARAPWLEPFATLERLFGRVFLAITVGAEVHPLDERYTVKSGTETRDVFVPWRVRPAAAARIGVIF